MPDLKVGETIEMKGSGAKPYVIKNCGAAGFSCTCPAWRNQSIDPARRTCKHIRKLRGDAAEEERLGAVGELPSRKPDEADGKEGPPVLLAEKWDNETNLAGWWMSEKLDGVRAYWDGKQFLSRGKGNLFLAPPWFVEGLPPVPLDGELWIGRKAFQRASGIARTQDRGEGWRDMRYLIFDAPAHGGEFEARLRFLDDLLGKSRLPFVQLVEQQECRSVDHLRGELARVEALGGEGLMLRQPGSRYEAGRSSTLLKVKTFHDAEARVIGYEAGAGKHKGRVGSLTVELPEGKRFSVGTGLSDAERSNPPAIGSVITFRYQELTDAGVPRFPSYVGLRRDAAPSPAPSTPVAAKAQERKAVIVPAAPPTTASSSDPVKRNFELVDDKSSKFWEVWVAGCQMCTRYGKIGSEGQKTTKDYADAAGALKAMEKMIKEKTGKGYVEKT